MKTLKLSEPEREIIRCNMEKVQMEKEHKRQEEEMMERERATLKETLEKISEEEEKERKEKDEKKCHSYELSHLSEEFRKEQGSFAEEPSVTKAFISKYNRTSP